MKTGLEIAQMMVRGEVSPPSMATHFDMSMVEVSEGRALFRATANEMHLNPAMAVHGGFTATLLDSACGMCTLTTLPPGKLFTTIDLAIKYMRPVPQGEEVLCESVVQRPGRSVCFVEAWVKNKAGQVLAHATSSLAIIDMPN